MYSPLIMGQTHVLESSTRGTLNSFLINPSPDPASSLHQQPFRSKHGLYFLAQAALSTSNYGSDSLIMS